MPFLTDLTIEEWIRKDTVTQIEKQFTVLWNQLEREIKACIDDMFHCAPKLMLKTEYLQEQLEKTIRISDEWPEVALLSLGRTIEMWLLIILKKKNSPINENIIKIARKYGHIDKNEAKLLKKIRTQYNNLKHKAYFTIDNQEVKSLLDEFCQKIKIQ